MFKLEFFFFFNDTATTEIYTLSLHDALPISHQADDVAEVYARCGFNVENKAEIVDWVTLTLRFEIGRAHV